MFIAPTAPAMRPLPSEAVMAETRASVTVVIPTKNRPEELVETLDSVLRQTLRPREVVVVDQSDSEESGLSTKVLFEKMSPTIQDCVQLVYIRETAITGGAAARNRALQVAASKIILFLDDDVTLEERFIEELVGVYDTYPGADGVSGVVTNYPVPPAIWRLWSVVFTRGPFWDDRQPIYWRADRLRSGAPIRVSRFGAGLMSFRARVVKGLLFDEALRGVSDGEDVDFCARLKPGTLLLMTPRARLVHKRSPTGRSAEYWMFRHARTMWYLYLRNWNHGLRNRLCFIWLNVGYAVAASWVTVCSYPACSWAGLFRAVREARALTSIGPHASGHQPVVQTPCRAAGYERRSRWHMRSARFLSYWRERLGISLERRGVGGTLKRGLYYVKLYLTQEGRQERKFDSLFGVRTSGRIGQYDLGVTSPNVVYAGEYRATPVRDFLRILGQLGVDYRDWVFLDLGAGKGRALLLASQVAFKHIIGVEFSAELARAAEENVAAYRGPAQQCRSITVLCQDAAEYSIPSENVVIYLNNPFHGAVMERVLCNIGISLREKPRDLYVVYWNPYCMCLLDQAPFLVKTRQEEQYCIYRSRVPG